jgi:hypothetical protein
LEDLRYVNRMKCRMLSWSQSLIKFPKNLYSKRLKRNSSRLGNSMHSMLLLLLRLLVAAAVAAAAALAPLPAPPVQLEGGGRAGPEPQHRPPDDTGEGGVQVYSELLAPVHGGPVPRDIECSGALHPCSHRRSSIHQLSWTRLVFQLPAVRQSRRQPKIFCKILISKYLTEI